MKMCVNPAWFVVILNFVIELFYVFSFIIFLFFSLLKHKNDNNIFSNYFLRDDVCWNLNLFIFSLL